MDKRAFLLSVATCLLGILVAGCDSKAGHTEAASNEEQRSASSASSSAVAQQAAGKADTRPVLVAFGDSLTAGVVENTYPDYLQQLLDSHGYRYRVDNQGVSGDTSTDGLARIDNVIAAHPALVILEFGGNDGLRGVPVSEAKKNVAEMIGRFQQAQIPVVLAGITLPPNYGVEYVKSFTAIYPELAKQYHLRLLPFLLVDVYQHPEMMQPDGIHPNGLGNKTVAEDVFRFIQPVLKK